MRTYLVPVLTRYSAIIVQFGLVALITRILDRDDAGRYFVIMGVVFATYFVAGLGLPDGVVRFAPPIAATGDDRQARDLIVRGLRISLVSVPLCAAVIAIMVYLLTEAVPEAILAALWWSGYGVIFICAQMLVALGHSALGTSLFYSAANVGQVLVTVPLIVAADLHRLDSVLLATTAGTSVAAVGSLMIAWRCVGPVTVARVPMRQSWHQGVMIAAGRVVQSCLLWSPVWVAGLALGLADAATVGLASRLASAVAAAIAAVRFSIRPALARDAAAGDWHEIERHSSRIAFLGTVLALGAVAAVLLVGDPAITAVFGTDYRSAAAITALMLIGTLGESFAGPVDEILRMSGHAREVLVAQSAALAVSIISQAIAAATGGVTALAMAYGLTLILLYLAFGWRLRTLHGIVILPHPRSRSRSV